MSKEVIEEEEVYTGVMYTDGSCVLPLGASGGGCHGYLYGVKDIRKNGDIPVKYAVTTVGYIEKTDLIKYGDDVPEIVKPSFYYNGVYNYGINSTNNRAELKAVIDTIANINKKHKLSKLIINTDSMYVISVFTKIRNNNDKVSRDDSERPNIDLWHELVGVLEKYPDVEICKVKAHGTNLGNNVADRLAYAGREQAFKSNTINVDGNLTDGYYEGKYWKDAYTAHPLMRFKQTYFNLDVGEGRNMYPIMDYPTDVEHGKKSPEPIYGITYTKTPITLLESIKESYTKHVADNRHIAIVDLKTAYSQQHNKISEFLGEDAYNYVKRKLLLLGEDVIAAPIHPPGLAQSALLKTLTLQNVYKMFKDGIKDAGMFDVIDVTETLFNINDKGTYEFKFTNKDVGVTIPVDVEYYKGDITLNYGSSVLSYIQLRALGRCKAKFYLAIKRNTSKELSHYFIVESEEASGIYTNYYTNRVYL